MADTRKKRQLLSDGIILQALSALRVNLKYEDFLEVVDSEIEETLSIHRIMGIGYKLSGLSYDIAWGFVFWFKSDLSNIIYRYHLNSGDLFKIETEE